MGERGSWKNRFKPFMGVGIGARARGLFVVAIRRCRNPMTTDDSSAECQIILLPENGSSLFERRDPSASLTVGL